MTSETAPKPRSLFWKLLIYGLGGFVVFLGVASFVLREQIFQTLLDPGIPFQTYERPPAPDYALAESWAARPELENTQAPAVFFLHPTTYDGGYHWNAPFDRPQEAEEIARFVIPNFAAPFLNHDAQLYAPHYRQASLYTFMNNREDAISARLLAYEDALASFDQFVSDIDPDRPFLIVGVGQGALLGLGVLLDRVDGDEAMVHRLGAAYLLEAPVPLDLFAGPFERLAPCESEQDIRCVIAYSAAQPRERERIFALTERSMSWNSEGNLAFVADRGLLCTNPLLWTTTEDYAPARLHRGGAAAEGLTLDDATSAMANQTSAQCQNGVLMTERPRVNALRRENRLGEDRRVPHFNLFYSDLQQNAELRMSHLIEVRTEEARFAPAFDDPIEVGESDIIPVDPIRN